METESLVKSLAFVGVLVAVFGPTISFRAYTKKHEYEALLKEFKVKLNLGSLIYAFFRKDSDPLKPMHIKLAKIGFVHFAIMLIGILFAIFATGAVMAVVES